MTDPQVALANQLKNIQAKTGRSLEDVRRLLAASGLGKFGEKRSMLMDQLGLGHGDANTLLHAAEAAAATVPDADPLDAIYGGAKAHLRPLHEQVLALVAGFGGFEAAPKKAYVSLRRKKQFAMVGPATKDALEIGFNAKDLPAHARLKVLAPGGMCNVVLRLSSADEVDAALRGWLKQAYDAAG